MVSYLQILLCVNGGTVLLLSRATMGSQRLFPIGSMLMKLL